jgi:hypothetical protein
MVYYFAQLIIIDQARALPGSCLSSDEEVFFLPG